MLRAEEIMTTDVITIRPEATIHDAIELLLERDVSGLPVVDADGVLVGMITAYALLAMAYDKGVTHQRVSQHMNRNIVSTDTRATVNSLADLFILHRVRRLPVVKSGRLAGLISRSDVLRVLYRAEAPVCTA